MSDHKSRVITAQWVLERNLAWLTAAEVKVGVIVAIDTALLGSLGAAFSSSDSASKTAWAYLFAISASVAAIIGVCCAAMAVLPRTTGPDKSLVFFGRISSLAEAEYIDQFKNSSDLDLLDDWSAQIHRNAQIATIKYAWVRKSMYWSFFSLIPWLPAIVLLLKK